MMPNGKMTAKATHMQTPCAVAAFLVSRLAGAWTVLENAEEEEEVVKSSVNGCRLV